MRQGAVAVSIPADDVYRWRVLGVVMLGTFMSALDSSIVNVSLPNMMASFGASVDDIEWVVTGYMLGFSTFMPLTAWLRDRVGYRVLYIASLAVFIAGSALCGIAPNLPALVLARVIQAFGGGAITPTGLAMIAEVFPPKERGRALGLWGVGVVVGPAFGPTLGGYLTETLGWRSIFNINLPIGIVGLLAASRILRVDKPHAQTSRGFDLPGFVLLTTFLVAALLGLSNGNREGWSSSYVVTCALVTSVSFVLFLAVESIVSARILDLGLFRSPQFTVAMVVTAARSVALYGGIFLLPLFLQDLMGRSENRYWTLAASRRAGHGDGHAGFRPDCGAFRHAHTDDCWPYAHCLVHVDVPQTGRDHKHMGRALSNPDTRGRAGPTGDAGDDRGHQCRANDQGWHGVFDVEPDTADFWFTRHCHPCLRPRAQNDFPPCSGGTRSRGRKTGVVGRHAQPRPACRRAGLATLGGEAARGISRRAQDCRGCVGAGLQRCLPRRRRHRRRGGHPGALSRIEVQGARTRRARARRACGLAMIGSKENP